MPYADPEKQREYQRKWARRNREQMYAYRWERYHRRRQEAIERLGGKCVVCGTTEDLEFDHIDPKSKKFNFSTIFHSYSDDRLRAELQKAQILCESCHGMKSRQEQLALA